MPMRNMAKAVFEVHAQTVEDEGSPDVGVAQNISVRAGGMAGRSLEHHDLIDQAFRDIVNMLHGVRDGNNHERQSEPRQI